MDISGIQARQAQAQRAAMVGAVPQDQYLQMLNSGDPMQQQAAQDQMLFQVAPDLYRHLMSNPGGASPELRLRLLHQAGILSPQEAQRTMQSLRGGMPRQSRGIALGGGLSSRVDRGLQALQQQGVTGRQAPGENLRFAPGGVVPMTRK